MTVSATKGQGDVLAGIGWMVLTTVLFACVTAIVRHVGTSIPATEAAFLRYAFGVVFMLPLMGAVLRTPPSRRSMGVFALRGTIHAVGVILWFYAMARIPIAEVTALGYLTPLCVTVGAALFLGERLHMRRIGAVLAGIAGAMIIIRPGFQEISTGQLAQLASAPFFAASYLIAKRISADGDPAVIVGMLSIFCALALLPGAIAVWVPPRLDEVAWFALNAAIATGAHYAMTRALRCAPITVTQPVTFLQLVWATLLGITLFGEPVDPFVILGGGIVIAAATFIAHREARVARRPVTPPAPATKD